MTTTPEKSHEPVTRAPQNPPTPEQATRPSFIELMGILAEQSHMAPSRKATTVYELRQLAYRYKSGAKDITGSPVMHTKLGAVEKARRDSMLGTDALAPMDYDEIKAIAAKKGIATEQIDDAEMVQKAETLAAYGMLPSGWTPGSFAEEISRIEIIKVASPQEFVKRFAEAEKTQTIIRVSVPGWTGVQVAGFANPNFGMTAQFAARFHGTKRGWPVPVDTGVMVQMSQEKLKELSQDENYPPPTPEASIMNYGDAGLPVDPMDLTQAAIADLRSRF